MLTWFKSGPSKMNDATSSMDKIRIFSILSSPFLFSCLIFVGDKSFPWEAQLVNCLSLARLRFLPIKANIEQLHLTHMMENVDFFFQNIA